MRVIIALLVIAVLMLLMCGCSKPTSSEVPEADQLFQYTFIIWADPSPDSLYIVRKTDFLMPLDSTTKFVVNSSDSFGVKYSFKGNNNYIFTLKSIGQDGIAKDQYNVKNY